MSDTPTKEAKGKKEAGKSGFQFLKGFCEEMSKKMTESMDNSCCGTRDSFDCCGEASESES